MYAFNKRFRPTLWAGVFVIQTLACLVITFLLWIFAVGSWIQAQSLPAAVLLMLSSAITMYFAIDSHRNQDRARIVASILVGRRESQQSSMELGRGKGLSE